MGGSISKEETIEEKRRKLLLINGVLIPPSFLERQPLSSAGFHFVQQQKPIILAWDAITRSPGQRLLQEYFQPGIWLAGSSTTDHSTVFATLDFASRRSSLLASDDDDAFNFHGGDGMLCLSHSFHPDMSLILLAPTSGLPSLTLMQSLLGAQLRANVNGNGHGWIGGSLEMIQSHPSRLGLRKILIGSGAEFQLSNIAVGPPLAAPINMQKDEKANASARQSTSLHHAITALHGLAGIDIHGTLLAATVQVSIDDILAVQALHLMPLNARAFVHSNLNLDDQPPLWFTAQAHAGRGDFSVQVCQTLTFDRYVWNLMEDRAPRIRNSLTWTVEMSKNSTLSRSLATSPDSTARTVMDDNESCSTISNDVVSSTNNNHNNSHQTTPTRLSAGVAWQFNRNLAVKAATTPSEGFVRGAIIFHRWKQPRLTCSLIGEYSVWNPQMRFVGVGVELGSINSSASAYHGSDYTVQTDCRTTDDRATEAAVDVSSISSFPETKVILP